VGSGILTNKNLMKETIKETSERIATDFALSIKERTDQLLKLDCNMYTELGSESLKSERLEAKKNSKFIYKQIKGIDEVSGNLLLKSLDA
jgi:hypothetical protein|tara:strand:+ start:760 stop:1029 length:270 start_codon:yes stop_codon:yes gene_type:complete